MKIELDDTLVEKILDWNETADEFEESCYITANNLLAEVAIELNNQKIKEDKQKEIYIEDLLDSVSC